MNANTAIKIMLFIVVALTIFHFSILLKIIPYDITWGGRLKNDAEMYAFETVSLLINAFLGLLLLIKGQYIKPILPAKLVNGILWAFVVLFALNTVGNIVAQTNFEKTFALLTFLCSVLIWKIVRAKETPVALKEKS